MTFDEYSKMPNKQWWQVTDQGYWDAGFAAGAASRDAEIAELNRRIDYWRDTARKYLVPENQVRKP